MHATNKPHSPNFGHQPAGNLAAGGFHEAITLSFIPVAPPRFLPRGRGLYETMLGLARARPSNVATP
jgi:hypothetical protein